MFHNKVAPQYHYLCEANEAHSRQDDVPTGPQAGQDRFADWHVEPRKKRDEGRTGKSQRQSVKRTLSKALRNV